MGVDPALSHNSDPRHTPILRKEPLWRTKTEELHRCHKSRQAGEWTCLIRGGEHTS